MAKFSNSLRDAGAKLWSDKQILPGGHWDSSIETALESCSTFVVLISKASINSNNVMDEVSYALEENKKVIPILLEQCDLPFRLRRIQFIDLTQNPEKGMSLLKSTLNLTSTPSSSLTYKGADIKSKTASEIKKTEENLESISKKSELKKDAVTLNKIDESTKKDKETENTVNLEKEVIKEKIVKDIPKIEKPVLESKNEKSKNNIVKIAIPIVLIFCAYFVYSSINSSEKTENTINEEVINEEVLKDEVVKEEKVTIPKIDETSLVSEIEPIKTDSSEWNLVKNSKDIIEYKVHMRSFSECIHTKEANEIIKELVLKNEENEMFTKSNSSKKLLKYINKYGKEGEYFENAIDSLDVYYKSSGFVQFSSSIGKLYFENMIDVDNKIPSKGDLIIANSRRNLHLSAWGTPNYHKVTYTTSVNEVFKVKNVQKTGSAYWVEVSY